MKPKELAHYLYSFYLGLPEGKLAPFFEGQTEERWIKIAHKMINTFEITVIKWICEECRYKEPHTQHNACHHLPFPRTGIYPGKTECEFFSDVKIPAKEILEHLYLKDEKSVREIAPLLSTTPYMITKWLRHYEIKIRTNAEANVIWARKKREKREAEKQAWEANRTGECIDCGKPARYKGAKYCTDCYKKRMSKLHAKGIWHEID